MEAKELFDKVKSFDFNKFSWKEAVAGPDGKSSAGKMLCFWYGMSLIAGTLICFALLIMKKRSDVVSENSLNNCFLFIGVQMPLVLSYLLTNKSLEIKKETEVK